MGQTRPVTAIKLMINNSIEMKLDEIQKKKANLANLSLKPMSRKELEEQKVSFASVLDGQDRMLIHPGGRAC